VSEEWPKREDTREFKAVAVPQDGEQPQLPPVQSLPDEPEEGPWVGRDFAWG
jgi:hypothetical protein